MKGLLQFLRPYRFKVLLGMATKLLEAILELILPLLMAQIIDIGIYNHDTEFVVKMVILMFITILTGLGCALLCQHYAAVAAQGMGKALRDDLMKRIQFLSPEQFDQVGSAAFMNRITGDVNQVVNAVNMFIRLVSRAPFLCAGALVMSFWINPAISVLFAVFIPLFALILFAISHYTVPLYQKAQSTLDNLALRLQENLSGVRVIRAFTKQKQQEKKLSETADTLAKRTISVANLSALLNPVTNAILSMGIILILYIGSYQVNAGKLPQGDLVALIHYMTQILLALTIIANLVVLFTKAAASARRIEEIRNLSSPPTGAENGIKQSNDIETVLDVENVSFSFGGENTLEGISFHLSKGMIMGIIGTTGSGKSTLANLIPRLYQPQEGVIRFCGENVSDWNLAALRAQISMAPQQTRLFSGSVRQNLLFAKQDASDEEMIRALKDANAWEFVRELPGQLDAPIFEGGKNLSGGQKQRLTIARTLLRPAKLYLFDDTFSALDSVTAAQIQNTLSDSYRHAAILFISQRLSSLAAADIILVLDEGKLAGIGTRAQLLQSCPVYRHLYKTQRNGEMLS